MLRSSKVRNNGLRSVLISGARGARACGKRIRLLFRSQAFGVSIPDDSHVEKHTGQIFQSHLFVAQSRMPLSASRTFASAEEAAHAGVAAFALSKDASQFALAADGVGFAADRAMLFGVNVAL